MSYQSPSLTKQELLHLLDTSKFEEQVEQLEAWGVPFEISLKGNIKVLRTDLKISFQCRPRVVLGLLYAFKPKGSKAWGGSFFRTPFGPPGDITSVMAVKQPGEPFFRTPFLPSCTTNRRDMRAVRLKSVANQSGNCPSTRAMRFRHGEPMAVGESPAPFSMSEAALKVEAQSGLTSPQKKLLSGPGEPRAHHEYGKIVSRSNALPSLSLFPWWPSNGTATAPGIWRLTTRIREGFTTTTPERPIGGIHANRTYR